MRSSYVDTLYNYTQELPYMQIESATFSPFVRRESEP